MRRYLLWLARWTGMCVMWVPPRLIRSAERTVADVEKIPGVISGDYRRCEALGRLVKRGPEGSKREKAMVIEYVIRQGVI